MGVLVLLTSALTLMLSVSLVLESLSSICLNMMQGPGLPTQAI